MPRADHEPEYRRRIRQKAEQHRQAAEAERKEAENKGQIEALVGAIHRLRQEFGSANNEQTPQTKHERRWRKLEVFGLWAAALVGVAAIIVGNHDANQQRGVMSDQLKASQAAIDATNRLADASKISADAAQAGERAWVGPSGASTVGTLTLNTDLQVSVPYHNTGREPALDFFFDPHVFTISLAEDGNGVTQTKLADYLNECVGTMTNPNGGVVYPTTGFSSYTLGVTVPAKLIDDDVIYGVKFIVVDGCFVYNSHGSTHWSTFCFFYQNGKTKPDAWNFCRGGNYAD